MKKVLTLLVLAVLFGMVSIEEADAARIRIPVGSYEKIKKVYDLPQDEMYVTDRNEHFDLGVMYTVYQICWIPLWTQESPRLVGYINDDSYVKFDDEDLEVLAELNDIENIKKYEKMPFWDAWGGKLIAIIIIGAIVSGYFMRDDDDDDDDDDEKEEEKTV